MAVVRAVSTFTLARRSGEAVRISVKADRVMEERPPEANQLFEKVVGERGGTEDDMKMMSRMWKEMAFKLLELPDEEVFDIEKINIVVPAYAQMHPSMKCTVCGEFVMEPRIRIKDGRPVCIPCSGQEYYQLTGNGMTIIGQ